MHAKSSLIKLRQFHFQMTLLMFNALCSAIIYIMHRGATDTCILKVDVNYFFLYFQFEHSWAMIQFPFICYNCWDLVDHLQGTSWSMLVLQSHCTDFDC